jgi:hypothetical protein
VCAWTHRLSRAHPHPNTCPLSHWVRSPNNIFAFDQTLDRFELVTRSRLSLACPRKRTVDQSFALNGRFHCRCVFLRNKIITVTFC